MPDMHVCALQYKDESPLDHVYENNGQGIKDTHKGEYKEWFDRKYSWLTNKIESWDQKGKVQNKMEKKGKMAKLRSANLKKKKGKMANPGQNVRDVVSWARMKMRRKKLITLPSYVLQCKYKE